LILFVFAFFHQAFRRHFRRFEGGFSLDNLLIRFLNRTRSQNVAEDLIELVMFVVTSERIYLDDFLMGAFYRYGDLHITMKSQRMKFEHRQDKESYLNQENKSKTKRPTNRSGLTEEKMGNADIDE